MCQYTTSAINIIWHSEFIILNVVATINHAYFAIAAEVDDSWQLLNCGVFPNTRTDITKNVIVLACRLISKDNPHSQVWVL